MTRALEVNDETAQNQERQPQRSGDKHDQKLHGKSFQVNENSVEEGEPISPATTPKACPPKA